jgi:leader peptidase (prepilin peptidase)/N-methyltransferase
MSSPTGFVARPLAPAVRRGVRFAWQAPLTVALAAVGTVVVGVRFELVGVLYLAVVTPELCRIDLAEHRLPNRLVLPGCVFTAIGMGFGWFSGGGAVLPAIVSLVAVGGFFLLLATAGGVGMGDVKLAATIAMTAGSVSVSLVIGTVIVAFLVAGAVAVVTLVRRGGGETIAFGPYLLGGFWTSVAAAVAF